MLWPFFCMLGKWRKEKERTAESRSLQNWNLSPTTPCTADKNYSRNRQALAALVTTASANWNLKLTALKPYIYIALPWKRTKANDSQKKKIEKSKPWRDLRTPFFAVESFSCISSTLLLTLNFKSLFQEKQLPTANLDKSARLYNWLISTMSRDAKKKKPIQGAQEQQHRGGAPGPVPTQLGYSRTRTSQLLAECSQFPPRNADQRERQTFEDQPQCIHDDSDIELTSTNDAPSIILILSQIAGASRLITDGPMHLLENNDLRTEFMRSKKITISNVYKKDMI